MSSPGLTTVKLSRATYRQQARTAAGHRPTQAKAAMPQDAHKLRTRLRKQLRKAMLTRGCSCMFPKSGVAEVISHYWQFAVLRANKLMYSSL
eukprot:10992-Heterococcus_DN1.PRE.9